MDDSKPVACKQLSIFHIELRLKTCLLMIHMKMFAFVPAALPIYQFCIPVGLQSVSSFQFVVAALWWVTLFLSSLESTAQIFLQILRLCIKKKNNQALAPTASCCRFLSALHVLASRIFHICWHVQSMETGTLHTLPLLFSVQVHLNHQPTFLAYPRAIICVLARFDTPLHLLLHLFPNAAQKQYRVVPSRHLSNNGCAPRRFFGNSFCSECSVQLDPGMVFPTKFPSCTRSVK